MMRRLHEGKITDGEINKILDSGDKAMKGELERVTASKEKAMQHVNRIHGKGTWDGIDNDGNLYKDSVIPGLKTLSKKNSKKDQAKVLKALENE